jgi:hypothetical protein
MNESGSRFPIFDNSPAAIAMPTNMKRCECHRRDILKAVTLGAAGFFPAFQIGVSARRRAISWPMIAGPRFRIFVRWRGFTEKAPMILLTDRPPQPKTPLRYFLEDFTPNEAFYVRRHFASNPTEMNAAEWRLDVTGSVNRRLPLGLDDLLHQFEAVSKWGGVWFTDCLSGKERAGLF